MPEAMVQQIVANFPDLDRLEGYSPDMTCDPPSDYYDARYKNEGNLFALIHWLNDHLMTTRRSTRPPLPASCRAASAPTTAADALRGAAQ
jgi:hypothetical protein